VITVLFPERKGVRVAFVRVWMVPWWESCLRDLCDCRSRGSGVVIT